MSDHNICVSCPHCHEFILISEIKCAIFRHVIYKHNGQQIDPAFFKRNL